MDDPKRVLEEIRDEVLGIFPPRYQYNNSDIDRVKRDRDALRGLRSWITGRITAALSGAKPRVRRVRVVSHFGPLPWRARLRVLFGGGVTARATLSCEGDPGLIPGPNGGDLYARPPGEPPNGAFPQSEQVTGALRVVGWSE